MKKVKSSGIRNIQKIDKEDGDGTATRKMIDNLGQVGAGVARVAGRTALGTAQSVIAAPGAIKKAIQQRKDDVKSGVSKKLGSRFGLRKPDAADRRRAQQDRLEKIRDRKENARQKGIRQRAQSIKKAGDARRERLAQYKRGANQSGPEQGPKRPVTALATRPVQKIDTDQNVSTPIARTRALPPAKDTKASTDTPVRKALPAARDRKALPAARSPKALPPARDSAGSRARRDPEEKKRMIKARGGSVTEQFLNEVEDMKKDKVDKVIDIMRGKNKVEVNPKISESHLLVQDLADYKPLEIEIIDLIKPEPLKASNWRNEISEEDKKIISINKGKRLDAKKQAFKDMIDEPYETDDKKRKEYGKKLLDRLTKVDEGAAWTKKEGKNKSGGLNEKGRKSYERENPGSDLKAPSKKVGNPRRKSFCARMKGMKKKLTSKKTASDPNSRINKSLRAWNC